MEVPTFRPTRKEFACFLKYIATVEKDPAVIAQGCCKVCGAGRVHGCFALRRVSPACCCALRVQIIPPAGWATFDYDVALKRIADVS